MSIDRIDHATRALIEYDAALEVMESEGITDGTVVASAMLAQVHATLALVEQQRIANLQTERRDLRARIIGRLDDRAALENARAATLDEQITEALGLS